MDQSSIGSARVTAEPAVSEVVHRALLSLGWAVRGGGAGENDQLEIVDFAAFRACSESEREARFPRADRHADRHAARRACVLVCRPDEYPDAPHDRFDAVVTEPVSAPRLLALVAALFPPREVASSEP